MMKKIINILFVGSTLIGEDDATGRTMENLFLNMPNVKWLQACLDYDSNYHVEKVPTIYINKNKSTLFYVIKQVYRKKGASTGEGGGLQYDSKRKKLIVKIGKGILDVLPHRFGKEAEERINSFSPDIIYTTGVNIINLRTSYKYSKKYGIPIILHVMDNIDDCIYDDTRLFMFRKLYKKWTNKVYERSTINLAIGEKMARAYSERHGKPFGFAMNCVDEGHYIKKVTGKERLLIFSGRLHGGREEVIREIDNILIEVNNKSDVNRLRLEVYTDELVEDRDLKFTSIRQYVPREEMFSNLARADVLLHCESFESEFVKFYKYSMSTKIPEYLSVGRPLLVYGPKDIATVEYVMGINVGWVAENSEDLKLALNNILNLNDIEFEGYCNRAINAFYNNHLSKNVRKNVYDNICDALAK